MTNPYIKQFVDNLKNKKLYRERSYSLNSGLLNFSSNDYLSLRTNLELQQAFINGFERYPIGSGSSRVLSGFHDSHHQLEHALATKLNVDSGLLFNSGYAANLGVISLLAKSGFNLLIDKGVHASIYDGIKLSGVSYQRYSHNDVDSLAKKLVQEQNQSVVITESLFSMSGQYSDLKSIATACEHVGASLIVDEAHAFGIIGHHGLGGVAQSQLTSSAVPLRIIGFGKAMGCQGAIVVGQKDWVDALYQSARSHIYTTAMSPAIAYGLLQSAEVLYQSEGARNKLNQLIYYFQQCARNSSLPWRASSSPIQQLRLGCPRKALVYSEQLKTHGIVCLPIREPTVNAQDTGLRVVLNAHHEPEDINSLFYHLHQIHEY